MKPTKIIQNAVSLPDGRILLSTSPANPVDYYDDRGNLCSIWGGLEEFHYCGKSPYPGHGCEDLSLTTGSLDDEVMDRLIWGTLGRDGWKQRPHPEYTYLRVQDMSTGHLINCMSGGWVRPGSLHYAVMARTLLSRILDPNFQIYMVNSEQPFVDLYYDLDLAVKTVEKNQEQGSVFSLVVPARIQP
jgi:hypothetical protein